MKERAVCLDRHHDYHDTDSWGRGGGVVDERGKEEFRLRILDPRPLWTFLRVFSHVIIVVVVVIVVLIVISRSLGQSSATGNSQSRSESTNNLLWIHK